MKLRRASSASSNEGRSIVKIPFEFTIETMVSQPEAVEKGNARFREVPRLAPQGQKIISVFRLSIGAGEGIRTLDPDLGKVIDC
jgi:hypothetical protein